MPVKPTGSWSLNWFVIYPEKMTWWTYESYVWTVGWRKKCWAEKIITVKYATDAVALRKPGKCLRLPFATARVAYVTVMIVSLFARYLFWRKPPLPVPPPPPPKKVNDNPFLKVGSLSYGQLMQILLFVLHSYLLRITIILSVLKSLTILGLSQPEAAQSCEILTLPWQLNIVP